VDPPPCQRIFSWKFPTSSPILSRDVVIVSEQEMSRAGFPTIDVATVFFFPPLRSIAVTADRHRVRILFFDVVIGFSTITITSMESFSPFASFDIVILSVPLPTIRRRAPLSVLFFLLDSQKGPIAFPFWIRGAELDSLFGELLPSFPLRCERPRASFFLSENRFPFFRAARNILAELPFPFCRLLPSPLPFSLQGRGEGRCFFSTMRRRDWSPG